MEPDGIELPSKSQQQALNLQRLHDEEQSFLRNGTSNKNYDQHDDEEGFYYSVEQSDCAIVYSAYSRLSCPARFVILFIVSTLAFYGVYTLGVDEGVREESHDANRANDHGKLNGADANKHYQSLQNAFTPVRLHNTRKASNELIDLLHAYYGGKEKAKAMLMKSWQASWELDVELFLSQDEGLNEDGTTDDDDQTADRSIIADSIDDDDDSNEQITKKAKRKKNKTKNKNDDKRELKKAKTVKALNDPADMNAQDKKRWHEAKRERVTKLITTMARALLNPNQHNFIIGTIGRCVSFVILSHDTRCEYFRTNFISFHLVRLLLVMITVIMIVMRLNSKEHYKEFLRLQE